MDVAFLFFKREWLRQDIEFRLLLVESGEDASQDVLQVTFAFVFIYITSVRN